MSGKPGARGTGLSRERVLAAALELADAEGLEALSFRRVATRLGVTPMALYRYVDDKDALLDGVGDLVLAGLELSDPGGDWRDELRAAARSFRRVLLRHPAAVHVFLRRPLFTPAGLRTADAMLGILRRAGFAPERAAVLHQQIARFLLALVVLETSGGRGLSAEERAERALTARITLETLPPERFPNLVEAAPYLATTSDPAQAFEAGLDLLVEGVDQLRPARAEHE